MPTIRLQQLDLVRACFCAAPLLFTACANQPEATEQAAETAAIEPEIDRLSIDVGDQQLRRDDSLLSRLVIYFDFDDSAVGPDYAQMLAAHGRYLADNSDLSLRLDGHADERGTREYNVGLGARRATAVRRLLLLQGAREDQIEIFSYGEERPAVVASDNRAWSLNRRVEFDYQ